MPTLAKSTRTRQRILDAAAAVIAEEGYAGTRLSDIAERADMQAGSLYYYFASKEVLVEEVLRHAIASTHKHVRDAVESLPSDASDLDRFKAAITAHLASILELGDYTAANLRILGQLPPDMRHRHQRDQAKYGTYWAKLIADAQRSGAIRPDLDATTVRLFIIGSLNWIIEWPESTKGPVAQLAATFHELVLSGLLPRKVR